MEEIPRYKKNEKTKKRQEATANWETQEEHIPQSTPSTAACRIPLCAILQLAQPKILCPLLTQK